MKRIVISLLVVSMALAGCVKPPQEAEPVNLLALIEEVLLRANEVRYDADGRNEFAEEGRQLETLIAFYEGSKIIFTANRLEPSTRDLVCTNGHNEFLILRDMYTTMGPDKTIAFSLNGDDWYYGQNDSKKGIFHIATDYHFDPEFNPKQNVLTVGFKGSMRLSDTAEPFRLKNPRETVYLNTGMILYDGDDKKSSLDLKRQKLFIRKGTVVTMDMSIGGNIVTSTSSPEKLVFTAAKDLYIYRKPNNMAGLSFDNQDWSVSPFAFKIDRNMSIVGTGPKSIFADFQGIVSYNGK